MTSGFLYLSGLLYIVYIVLCLLSHTHKEAPHEPSEWTRSKYTLKIILFYFLSYLAHFSKKNSFHFPIGIISKAKSFWYFCQASPWHFKNQCRDTIDSFFFQCQGPNSGPYICEVSTLPQDYTPSPINNFQDRSTFLQANFYCLVLTRQSSEPYLCPRPISSK